MAVYYVLYAFLGVVAYFCSLAKDKQKAKKAAVIICTVSLILLFGLRHPSMGHDLRYGYSNGYIGNFYNIGQFSWGSILKGIKVQNYEFGYIVFNKLIYSIWPSHQFFLFVCAAVIWGLLGYTIYKNSDSPIFTFIIFMGLPSFLMIYSGLRQALAFSIAAFAFNYIKNKDLVKFIVFVLLASLFHDTAIVFLVSYPLYNAKRTQIFSAATVILIPLVYLFRYPLFSVFSKIFKEGAQFYETSSYTLMIIFYLVYIFCTIFIDKMDIELGGMLNLFLMACICQMFGSIYNLAMRVGYYFMIFLALLLPKVVSNVDKSENGCKIFKILVAFAFILYALTAIKNSTWACANPYHFFWETII